jgi:hypothetical protein
VAHDVRDLVVDFVRCWSEKTEIGTGRFIHWLGVRASKFYDWRERYGRMNEHNGWVPRDFWLQPWEKQSIIRYYLDHPLDGYRLEEARHQRQLRRAARSLLAHSSNTTTMTSPGETEAGSAGMQPC